MGMARTTTTHRCSECGWTTNRWVGRCGQCQAWGSLAEVSSAPTRTTSLSKPTQSAQRITQIEARHARGISTGIGELDRVLGDGLVPGAVVLLGGEPGVGKSTLLLQICSMLAQAGKTVLYISGEESARQIKLRAKRVGAGHEGLLVLAENAMDEIEDKLEKTAHDLVIVDSIQTMYRPEMASAPGSVSQVRECASLFMRYAKTNGCAIFLVGHVTKDGSIAGPRVLEHMVDVVLYFEGDYQREYRLLRAVKNRYGSVNELGIFEMTGEGMRAVDGASELLLSQRAKDASGSVVFCGMEGTRPVLMDIQALVAQSFYSSPKRTVNGMDQGRVALLLAVLEKRAGLRLYNQDVYLNVAGGMSLNEPAADLAVCLAVASSLWDSALPMDLAAMGEVGLAGEVRSIPQLERRMAECKRLGFTKIMCPADRKLKGGQVEGIQIIYVSSVAQAIGLLKPK